MKRVPQGSTVDWYPYDYRFSGPYPALTDTVTLSAGQNLDEGSVLGRVTATGEYVLSCKTKPDGSAVNDGSEVPRRVLIEACDATAGDKTPGVYKSGQFHTTFLKLGAGHTFPEIKDALEAGNIYFDYPAT